VTASNVGKILFSAADVLRIRLEAEEGRLSVRSWADAKGVTPETIRKIARGDTYRYVRTPEDRTERLARDQAPTRLDYEPAEGEVAQSAARFAELLKQHQERSADSMLEEIMKPASPPKAGRPEPEMPE
jgi:hypothetical protein